MRRAVACMLILLASGAPVRADVGGPANREVARLQSTSEQFRAAPVDRGALSQPHTERWKFSRHDGDEQWIFTIDADTRNGLIVRETFVRMTEYDPYALTPHESTGASDLRDVLSSTEYQDYRGAAADTTIAQTPLHATARFYRGKLAAYEVIEPDTRHHGRADRFEWRSFELRAMPQVIAAARRCDNGEDCAAWF